MLILLILLGVAGLAVAVIALRADSNDSVPLKAKASMAPPLMSAPFAPTADTVIPKEPKKNPLSMLTQIFKKKPKTAPLAGSSAVVQSSAAPSLPKEAKKNPLSMLTGMFKKKV